MKHSRLSPDGTMPHLDAVTAIPYGGDVVGLYLDAKGGNHFRALLNGRVLVGADELDAVSVNAGLEPKNLMHDGEISDQAASIAALNGLYREEYGVLVHGRESDAYMYKADDGVNKGVRPLK